MAPQNVGASTVCGTCNQIRPAHHCQGCNNTKPHDSCHFKPKGVRFTATCLHCLRRVSKNSHSKENIPPTRIASQRIDEENEDNPNEDTAGLSVLGLNQFLDAITEPGVRTFQALVNVEELDGEGREQKRADTLARVIWEKTDYRWL
jgi:hypothetical protein